MVHYAGYCPRFHPSDFEVRTRDGVGEDWPISYEDLKPHYERLELELPVAGRVLAVGRPAPLPAHAPHPIAGGAEARLGGRAQARDRDARRAGRDHQRRLRQPAALHLPRLLPAGLQGQRQGLAARHAHPRRDRARRRDPRRLHGAADRGRRRRAGGSPASRYIAATGASASSAPTRSRSPATRSRRRGCCSTRPAARFPHGLGQRQRPGRPLRDGAGRAAGRRALPGRDADVQGAAAGDLLRAVLRDRPDARASRAGFSIQTVGPLPIELGPARARPTATGARRCASTCATTTTGTRSASCASCCRCPRTASRSPPSVTDQNGIPVARMDYSQCENDRKNIAFAKQTLHDIFEAGGRPGHARRSTATRTSSAAAGWARTPSAAWSTPTTARGRCRTCSSPTAA